MGSYGSSSTFPSSIALDETSVYWTVDSSTLMKVPISGGSPVTLTSGLASNALAVDAFGIYATIWGSDSTGSRDYSLLQMQRSGETSVVLATDTHMPVGIAADSNGVYWTSASDPFANDGSVKKVPLAGVSGIGSDAPVVVASGQVRASAIVTGAGGVYLGRLRIVILGGMVGGAVMRFDSQACEKVPAGARLPTSCVKAHASTLKRYLRLWQLREPMQAVVRLRKRRLSLLRPPEPLQRLLYRHELGSNQLRWLRHQVRLDRGVPERKVRVPRWTGSLQRLL